MTPITTTVDAKIPFTRGVTAEDPRNMIAGADNDTVAVVNENNFKYFIFFERGPS